MHTPTPDSGVTPVVIRDHPTLAPERRRSADVQADELRADEVPADEIPAAEVEAAEVEAYDVPAPAARTDEVLAVEVGGVAARALSGETEYAGYQAPKKSSAGKLAGIVTLLALVAFAGFLWSQRGDDGPPVVTGEVPAGSVTLIADSASLPATGTVPESTAVAIVPTVDSQAIRDSVRRVARAEAAKKAAARQDSLKKAQPVVVAGATSPLTKARGAVAAMLSDESARKAFERGATRMGGVLGTKRTGDLQTQIDALQPFLSQERISYEHFKILAQGAGVSLFDAEGRMLPAALRQFAAGN